MCSGVTWQVDLVVESYCMTVVYVWGFSRRQYGRHNVSTTRNNTTTTTRKTQCASTGITYITSWLFLWWCDSDVFGVGVWWRAGSAPPHGAGNGLCVLQVGLRVTLSHRGGRRLRGGVRFQLDRPPVCSRFGVPR